MITPCKEQKSCPQTDARALCVREEVFAVAVLFFHALPPTGCPASACTLLRSWPMLLRLAADRDVQASGFSPA